MGKFTEAEKTGECYNCGECVGSENLTTNIRFCWPVCSDCDFELNMSSEEGEY